MNTAMYALNGFSGTVNCKITDLSGAGVRDILVNRTFNSSNPITFGTPPSFTLTETGEYYIEFQATHNSAFALVPGNPHLAATFISIIQMARTVTLTARDQTMAYRYGFNTQMLDNNLAGMGNHLTAQYWEYDPRYGRRWNLDPVREYYISQYATFGNNPIRMTDVHGDKATEGDGDPSTHTDEEGNVVAVINDGDKGVYTHKKNADGSSVTQEQIKKRQEKMGTSAGGAKVGETEYWDEFIVPGTNIAKGTIHLGQSQSWKPLINWGNRHARNQGLDKTMQESKRKGILDIKTMTGWAADGPMTGRLLNGKYATARSAGNYLAGLNGVTGNLYGFHIDGQTYMKLAGAYQLGQLTNKNLLSILILGTSFGPPPYYGEEDYSGRRILEGINSFQGK